MTAPSSAGSDPGRDGLRALFEGLLSPEEPTTPLAPGIENLLAAPQSAGSVEFHHFGEYELLEELARGGMGVVFRAHDPRCHREVALKLILAGRLAPAEARRRFRLEAEAAAALAHPHIVPVYEVGELEGYPYLVMPVLEGGSLATRRAGFRDPARAAPFVAKLARAVQHAHERGVLHRDLKPGNVLLDGQGEPHLTDFGLAKWIQAGGDATASLAIQGTPAYLAPEQAAGHSREATMATDIHALGAILFELLAGRPPHQAETMPALLRRIAETEPVYPGDGRVAWPWGRGLRRKSRSGSPDADPPFPAGLEAVCRKCLAKEPGRRYRSAEELAADLDRWCRNEPVTARRAGSAEKLSLWCRRQPVVAGLVAATIVALGLGMAATTIQWRRAIRGEAAARRELAESVLNLARASRLSGMAGQRFETLALARSVAKPTHDLRWRNELIATLALPDVRPWRLIRRPGPHRLSLVVDADIERYAALLPSGDYAVRSVADDRDLFTLRPPAATGVAPPAQAGFNPGGHRFFASYEAPPRLAIWHWSGSGGSPTDRGALPPGTVRDLPTVLAARYARWSPSGEQLFTLTEPNRLGVIEARDGAVVREVPLPGAAQDFAVLARGDLVALLVDRSCIVVDRRDGRVLSSQTHPAPIDPLAFAAHGEATFGASRYPGQPFWTVHRWEFEGRHQPFFASLHKAQINNLVLDPAGRFLLTTGWDDRTVLWDPVRLEPLVRIEGAGNEVRLSRDGRRLAFFSWDHAVHHFWEIDPADEVRRLGRLSSSLRRFWPVDGGWGCAYDDGVEYLTSNAADQPISGRLRGDSPYSAATNLMIDSAGTHVPGLGWAVATTHTVRSQPISYDRARERWEMGPIRSLDLARPVSTDLIAAATAGTMAVTRANEIVRFDTSPARIVPLPGPPADRVLPSGSGRFCARQRDGNFEVWDAVDGRAITNVPARLHGTAAWSPDDRWIVARTTQGWQVWDARNWGVAVALTGESEVLTVPTKATAAFSRDGRLAALAGAPFPVRLFRTDTWTEVATLPAVRLIVALAFDEDASELAIASEVDGVIVWRLGAIRDELARLGVELPLGE